MADSEHDPKPSLSRVPTGPGWTGTVPAGRSEFFGDDNRFLKSLQDDSFPFLVYELFAAARRRYLDACTLTGVETELAGLVREIGRFARPFLHRAYRRIAAFYRFAHAGAPQLPLPFEALPDETRQRLAWEDFFRREARTLVESDAVAVALLRSVALAGKPAGRAAEAHLVDLLSHRYGRFTLVRRRQLLGLEVEPEEMLGWQFIGAPDWDQLLDAIGRKDSPVPGRDPDRQAGKP